MKEKRAWRAILAGKCPQCREGDLFPEPVYRSPLRMDAQCPRCGLQFEREPGFFYGAMYVSYALSVAIFMITVFVLYFLAGDPGLQTYIITITSVALILYPFTYRYSRILFIYIFGDMHYRPEKAQPEQTK